MDTTPMDTTTMDTTTMDTAAMRSRVRVIAVLLAAAALLWVGAYLQHPPGEGVTLARTMQVVIDRTAAWRWSHLGIAAGYLAAGLAAALSLRWRLTKGLIRAGWTAMAAMAVPLVGYLVIESTVVAEAALSGDVAAFELWYGTVSVWTWRISWPVFFTGMALVAAASGRASHTPRWSRTVAVAGAGFGALAPLFASVGLSGLSLAAFITPVTGWLWLAMFGLRAMPRKRTAFTRGHGDTAASR